MFTEFEKKFESIIELISKQKVFSKHVITFSEYISVWHQFSQGLEKLIPCENLAQSTLFVILLLSMPL